MKTIVWCIDELKLTTKKIEIRDGYNTCLIFFISITKLVRDKIRDDGSHSINDECISKLRGRIFLINVYLEP